MPTTTNFGWTTPADTDLVKDGALAIRTLGNGIDTSMVDLKGGTTGQILSKASNTDMDFTWIANDQGDITEVQAGTGISVASGTGPIPVVTNTVATAFDAKGDLIGGTGADTFSRLAVGTNGQVLTADSTTATGLKWATPSGGGKVLQVVAATYSTETTSSSSTYADTGLTATITPSASTSKILVLATIAGVAKDTGNTTCNIRLLRGATTIVQMSGGAGKTASTATNNIGTVSTAYLDSPATTSATTYKCQFNSNNNVAGTRVQNQETDNSTSSIVLLEIGA